MSDAHVTRVPSIYNDVLNVLFYKNKNNNTKKSVLHVLQNVRGLQIGQQN